MDDDTNFRLFEMAKQQDSLMHAFSVELSVKTSLYLVFAAFVLSSSIQVLNFARDMHTPSAQSAVLFCAVGAGIALVSGAVLLRAALIRQYKIFPVADTANWLKSISDYKRQYPEEEVSDPSVGLLQTIIQTVDANQIENEKKAQWIEVGAGILLIVGCEPSVKLAPNRQVGEGITS